MKNRVFTWLRGTAGRGRRVLRGAAFAFGLLFAALPAAAWEPGLFVGHIGGLGALDKAAPRPAPDRIAGSVEHGANNDYAFWGDRTMWVYWGQIHLDGSTYRFGENIDDEVYLVIDGETVLDDNGPSRPTFGTIQRPDGWYDFELRMHNGYGLAGPIPDDGAGFTATRGFCYRKGPGEEIGGLSNASTFEVPGDPGDWTLFRHSPSVWGPGLFVGHIGGLGALDKAAPRPSPDRIAGSVEHGANSNHAFWGDRTMWVYWGQIHLDGSTYRFGENIDDAVCLVIDGQTVLDDNGPSTPTFGTIQRPAGWYDFELRMYNGGGAAGPQTSNEGFTIHKGFCYAKGTEEEVGGLSEHVYFRFAVPADPGDGTFFRRGKERVRTISVNFTGGQGGNCPVSTGGFAGERIGYGVYAVEGSRWVDCAEAGGEGGVPETRIALALQDDTGAAAPYAGVVAHLCSRPGTWNDRSGAAQSGNAQMLRCFLDDDVRGSQPTPIHDHAGFKLENLPFSRYTVIVYFNRDGEGPIPAYSVNGRWYKGTSGGAVLAEPSETWGNSRPGAGALSEEENTLVVRGLTSRTLVVQSPGASSSARGCIAGFQVIGELERGSRPYMVVDLSGGKDAAGYPVTWLDGVPPGGWDDGYRTTKLALRRIGPGSFTMGSPEGEAGRSGDETPHAVTLTRPYYLGIFEVTQKQWERVTGGDPSSFKGDKRPVECVGYNDIRGAAAGAGWPGSGAVDGGSFMGKIRSKTGLSWFDLPTEAQWEYACRAGTAGPYNVDGKSLGELGRYKDNRSDGRGGYTDAHTAAGSYLPNAWGFWDMHGNVYEWCLDRYGALGAAAATDPAGAASGSQRVLRGGSFYGDDSAADCRSANRHQGDPDDTISFDFGFRAAFHPRTLAVASECGDPSPGAGERLFFTEEAVTASAESPVEAGGGAMRICTGWTGTGSVPAAGTNTSVTFTMSEDSSITWKWTPPSRRITVAVAEGGSADFSDGWVEDGTEVTVNVVKPSPGDEILLAGDAEGVRIEGCALKIPADRRRCITVAFDTPDPRRYLVVDLAAGADASNYPVSFLPGVPEGGWTEAHKTTKLVMRKIRPGTFTMGSPEGEPGRKGNETRHRVTLTEPFYIGVFEVTHKQYELAYMSHPGRQYYGPDRPVDAINYGDIRQCDDWPASNDVGDSFLWRIRSKAGLAGFDLPTEAQWEYACRAGTAGPYNVHGKRPDELGRIRDNTGDGKGGYTEGTTAAGSYLPNGWGLYDMHGNVKEVCLDRYQYDLGANAATNPAGPAEGQWHVARGGDYLNGGERCRSACRDDADGSGIGFRAACPVPLVLEVASARGAASPAAGEHPYAPGASVTASAEPFFEDGAGTRYVCTGWTGTGSVPASGTGTSVTFAMTEDSSITWNWAPSAYRISLAVTGGGSADCGEGAWAGSGTELTVNVTKPSPGDDILLAGDTEGVRIEGGALKVPADRPRRITVVFDAPNPARYMVVDLSGGTNAAAYPVSYSPEAPEGGWTNDVYKTERLVLRRIPAGAFTMGSPTNEPGRRENETLHRVTLTRPFYMGLFAVSQRQWELVMGSNPSELAGAGRPVERVTYNDIRGAEAGAGWPGSDAVDEGSFMGRVRSKTGLAGFDLPTEAQWEYACRAGTTTALNTGKDLTNAVSDAEMAEAGRYRGNKNDGRGGHAEHAAAGSYKPNAWGLYDMHGNVWETCLDRLGDRNDSLGTDDVTDPEGPETGAYVVFRGGCWNNEAGACRSAMRPDVNHERNKTDRHHGFRIAFRPAGRTLTVASEYGGADPAAGAHAYSDFDAVTASVASPVEDGAGTRHVCTGWTGADSVPAAGTGTSVSFTITNDSSITWNWRTEHWLTVRSVGGGSVNVAVSGWHSEGERVEIAATPGPGYAFDRWEGDTNGWAPAGLSAEVPADGPRTVTARFRDATKGTPVAVPFEWLRERGLAEDIGDCEAAAAGTARNGRPVWECYAAGLDPADPASRFLVLIDPEKTPILDVTPCIPEREYIFEGKTNLTDNAGENGGWVRIDPRELPGSLEETRGLRFFRVKVETPPAREETAGLAYGLEDDEYLVTGAGDAAAGSGTGRELVIPKVCDTGEGLHPVTAIGYGAFYDCRAFDSVTVPEGVRFIDPYAFMDSGLLTVNLPEGIEGIGKGAFDGTPWLDNWPDGLVRLRLGWAGGRSFVYCWKGDMATGTAVEIPADVKGIADAAFSGRTNLASVAFPTGLASIGSSAFRGCSGLTSVALPAGLETVWYGAFEECTGLSSVTVPAGAELLEAAFYGCSALSSITLSDGVRGIGADAFAGTRWMADRPGGLLRIGGFVCGWKGDMAAGTAIGIPAGVKGLADEAFYGRTNLTSVALPDGLEWIGMDAFRRCEGLTSLSLPGSVKRIGIGAFSYCKNLAGNVAVPAGVKALEGDVFDGCRKLGSVTLPDGLEAIGPRAFFGCWSLTNAVIPGSVAVIGEQAFEGTGLKTVVLPAGLTEIALAAFDNSDLVSVTIPAGVVSIDDGAFYNCTGLADVVFLGTRAQWAAIRKGEDWKKNVPATVVHCSDGDAAL